MTQTTDLARNSDEQQAIKQVAKRELTIEAVAEMTGYSLAEMALIRNTVAKDAATLIDLALFLTAAKKLELEPLLRQVHWIIRGGRGSLQVGIDGYRAVAERTGVYAGSEPPTFRGSIEQTYQDGNQQRTMVVPEKASVTVWKIVAGHKSAFTGEAWWTEFYPGQKEGFMYRKMPRHMLAKDAEAQALRKAFPAQLGAVAYAGTLDVTEADLPEVAAPPRVVEQPQLSEPKPVRTAADYERIFGREDSPGNPAPVAAQGEPVVSEEATQPPSSSDAPAVDDPAAVDEMLAKNAVLVEDARGIGVKGLGSLTAKSGWPLSKIEEANTELAARIRSRNGELDEAAAAEQARAF